jgi:hypothetical protein
MYVMYLPDPWVNAIIPIIGFLFYPHPSLYKGILDFKTKAGYLRNLVC